MKRHAIHFGRRDGQALILVVAAMSLLLIGALGFAIDGGQMYAQQQMAQAAADAAAQAGIMSILDGTNATSTYPFGTGSTPIASSTCTTTDGRTPCIYARYNGFGAAASDTVTLSFPAGVSGAALASVTVPAFQVTVQRTLQTGFIRFIGGPATTTITAKSLAGITASVLPDSVVTLGNGQNAFQASNGANVTVSGGGIAINSSNSDAATVSGGATVTASAITVVGGAVTNNGGTMSPAPVTGAAAISDPFASLPALTPGTCLYSSLYSPGAGTTLSPGTYCGGISVSNGASVTFSAGNYIINGGGVTFSGGATVTGSGVMFYLTGTNATYGSVNVSGGANVTLSAPTSGSYLGVLFFQNRSITSANNATFSGGASMQLTGSLYFPSTAVSFSNGAGASGYSTAIIASQIVFAGGANIKYDPTGMKTGLFTKSAALLQ